MKVTVKEFAAWCGASSVINDNITGVKIDSRKIEKGDAFFALKGEHVNGEDYALEALAKGASLAVVSEEFPSDVERLIKVKDVQYALQEAAKYYRQSLKIKIIAITGSVGKTTTKEIMKAVLSQKYTVFASEGNFNNEIGLPLMVFKLNDSYRLAVLEMGMSAYGEIKRLCDIARPEIAVITNIGTAHIEFFGSRENIAKAKFEMVEFLSRDDVLVLNANDDILYSYVNDKFKMIKVGKNTNISADKIEISSVGTIFDLCLNAEKTRVSMPLYGRHNVDNALLTVAVADVLAMDMASIKAGLLATKSEKMRFEIVDDMDIIFVNDAYNSSYDSIIASVDTWITLDFGKNYLVLGDVLECGDLSADLHKNIGLVLNQYCLDKIIFVGDAMHYAYREYQGNKAYFKTYAGIADLLLAEKEQIDSVLLKGSRGICLEKVLEEYRDRLIE